MSEHKKYINYVNTNYKLSEDINFNLIFDSLMEFCLKFNSEKFGINYSKSNFFIHIKGGASIKYKLDRYGLLSEKITDDIDIVIVPFENNPNIRIKLIEEFAISLKKELPNFDWKYKISDKSTKFYLNGIKIFDIVFYDNINPWYKVFHDNQDRKVFKKINKHNSVHDYFEKLKKKFESNIYNFEDLEKVTFTSIEFEYNNIITLKKYFKNIYNNLNIKMKEENVSENLIFNQKNKIKNKIINYDKKLFYLTHIMIDNNF